MWTSKSQYLLQLDGIISEARADLGARRGLGLVSEYVHPKIVRDLCSLCLLVMVDAGDL